MTVLMIHYHRQDGDYSGWDTWLWSVAPYTTPGTAYPFSSWDIFGAVAKVQWDSPLSQAGFVIRFGKDQWVSKELPNDRFFYTGNEAIKHIWVIHGDPEIYLTWETARATVFPDVIKAYLDGPGSISVQLKTYPNTATFAHAVQVKDLTNNVFLQTKAHPTVNDTNSESTHWLVLLQNQLDVTHAYVITGSVANDAPVIPRRVLNELAYRYEGTDLGCQCTQKEAHFRIWAPTASRVEVLIFISETDPDFTLHSLQKSEKGTWLLNIPGSWHGYYYQFKITVHGATSFVTDPYSKAISADRTRSMIVDVSLSNPTGWELNSFKSVDSPVDAVVYEVHIRDYSSNLSSGANHPGRYIQFADQGTRTPEGMVCGMDHLVDLGVTHVQLLPIAEFGRDSEDDPDEYNWGYDPRFYMVPEGRYATQRSGLTRILECKRMIQSFHQKGIGVILDVVFNHAFNAIKSPFHHIVPEYFFRTDDYGKFTDGAGVGNELASERPMVKKFIQDALFYWIEEFHVDGFRFDLMALIGTTSITQITNNLHKLYPHLLLYGEPWAGGISGMVGDTLLLKGAQKNLNIAVFNDDLRDALVGPVFEHKTPGYVSGNPREIIEIKKSIVGNIDFSSELKGFAASPTEVINYVSCHDNLTLWDRLQVSDHWETERIRMHMDVFAQTIIFTSQGIAFIQSGEEFLRTKHGEENTYLAGIEINSIDWDRKLEYFQVFSFYKGLIRLRKNHPAFRMRSAEQIRHHLEFLSAPENMIAWLLKDHANGDPWENVLVICNPYRSIKQVLLPPGIWTVTVDKMRAGDTPLAYKELVTEIAPMSCQVLYQTSL